MILIFDKDFARVEHIEELKLVKVIWKSNITSEEYKFTMITAIEYAEKIGEMENYMSDIRMQGVINPEVRKWFETEMIPRGIKSGLKRAAVVFSGNIFTKYYLNNIDGTSKKLGLAFKFFTEENAAYEWLKKII